MTAINANGDGAVIEPPTVAKVSRAEAAIIYWGFEFEWRESGSFPLQYRRADGCRHDWVLVSYDHPLCAAVRHAQVTDQNGRSTDV